MVRRLYLCLVFLDEHDSVTNSALQQIYLKKKIVFRYTTTYYNIALHDCMIYMKYHITIIIMTAIHLNHDITTIMII